MSPTGSDRREAWNQYWRSGALHSCAGSWSGNYGGAVRDFWQPHLHALDAGMRVLDLGTGNGPIPAMLAVLLPVERLPLVDAVDLSLPSPSWISALEVGVASHFRFHGGVAMERLPFADRSFDRVFSQFGFEYGERAASASELLRVLAPGGGVAMVCHHVESRLAMVAAEESAHVRWLLNTSGLFEAMTEVLPFAAQGRSVSAVDLLKTNAQAEEARSLLNRRLAELSARAMASAVPDLLFEMGRQFMELVRSAARIGQDAALHSLGQLRTRLVHAGLRSTELIEHALDREAAQRLAQALRDGGVSELAIDTLAEGPHLLGWSFVGRNSGA